MPYLTVRDVPRGDAAAVGVDLDQHHGAPRSCSPGSAHHQHRLAAMAVGELVEVDRGVVRRGQPLTGEPVGRRPGAPAPAGSAPGTAGRSRRHASRAPPTVAGRAAPASQIPSVPARSRCGTTPARRASSRAASWSRSTSAGWSSPGPRRRSGSSRPATRRPTTCRGRPSPTACCGRSPGRRTASGRAQAAYLDLVAGDRAAERAAWTYPHPTPGFEELLDHVAVMPAAVDACYRRRRAGGAAAGRLLRRLGHLARRRPVQGRAGLLGLVAPRTPGDRRPAVRRVRRGRWPRGSGRRSRP